MLQAFIRAVRHELDNPLAVVTGEAQLLKGEWIVQAEVSLERPVQAIHEAAERLCDLAARLAAVERDPDALVITSEGGVALRTADEGEGDADASAASAEARRMRASRPRTPSSSPRPRDPRTAADHLHRALPSCARSCWRGFRPRPASGLPTAFAERPWRSSSPPTT